MYLRVLVRSQFIQQRKSTGQHLDAGGLVVFAGHGAPIAGLTLFCMAKRRFRQVDGDFMSQRRCAAWRPDRTAPSSVAG